MNEKRSQAYYVQGMSGREVLERMQKRGFTRGVVKYRSENNGVSRYNVRVELDGNTSVVRVDFQRYFDDKSIVIWGPPATCETTSGLIAKILNVGSLRRATA